MKKLALTLLAALALTGASSRYGHVVTVTSGTPVHVTTSAIYLSRSMVQALHGGTSVIYVCYAPVGSTPHSKCSTDGELIAEISAASTANPGGSLSDPIYLDADNPVDARTLWVDGDHTGDTANVTGWRVR